MSADRKGAWVILLGLLVGILAVLLAGCAGRSRWVKVTTVTVPKQGFVFEEQFYTEYPEAPVGWPE